MSSLLGPVHPRLVHFPIALLLVGIAAIAWGIWRGQTRWIEYGRFSLLFGWIGVLLASASGLIDQSGAPNTPAVASTINSHITVGVALIIVFGVALYWPLRNRNLWNDPRRRWLYIGLLLVGGALVLLEGYLGGVLVYDLGVGVAR